MKFVMYSGRSCTIADADQADLSPERLGLKLAGIRRWQGMPGALSVLEHSMLTALLAHKFEGHGRAVAQSLVHDVAEAFTGDAHGPTKCNGTRMIERQIECDLRHRGWQALGVGREYKRYDQLSLSIERHMLWPHVAPKPDIFALLEHSIIETIQQASAPAWANMVREYQAYVGA